jgi:hypothetical protein
MCTKVGYALVYPLRTDLSFEKGGFDSMGSYQFGKKRHHHRFCSDCGTSVAIDFSEEMFASKGKQPQIALNVSWKTASNWACHEKC